MDNTLLERLENIDLIIDCMRGRTMHNSCMRRANATLIGKLKKEKKEIMEKLKAEKK